MAYLNVVKIDEALKIMQENFKTISDGEHVSLEQALGRFIKNDLVSQENLPAFRRSMVDGYAVLMKDLAGASEQSPILLKAVGEVQMGKTVEFKHNSKTTQYVPTGGEVPNEADAMVMIEHTECLGEDIAFFQTPRFGEHIVEVGEDIIKDALVISAGTELKSKHMGLLASIGQFQIEVRRKIKVAILSTGDELVEVSQVPERGQVRDCNRAIISAIVHDHHGEVVLSKKVKDDYQAIHQSVGDALKVSDVVLLSGGSSAGMKDLTEKVIDQFSKDSHVFIHGLAIKPGKPTIIGAVNGKAVIGLPGHPAACFTVMKALIEPFLGYLAGGKKSALSVVPCRADFQMHVSHGRDTYQLVTLEIREGELWAKVIYGKSGMVSAMGEANAYVVIPMNRGGIEKGDPLFATLL